MSEYKTVKKSAMAEYEEKRSRFIGAVTPVTTEQQALEFIAKTKQENFGARHNVYAYILRENNIARFSDDGEPHSTAGMPTLDVLKKQGLTDVCLVTTRYFGGVLLGTGGLVRAYTSAATMAIEAAGIAVMKECYMCKLICSYGDLKQVERTLGDNGGKITDTVFTDSVEVAFSTTADNFTHLTDKITDTFCGRISVEIVGNGFADV